MNSNIRQDDGHHGLVLHVAEKGAEKRAEGGQDNLVTRNTAIPTPYKQNKNQQDVVDLGSDWSNSESYCLNKKTQASAVLY